MPAQSTLVSSQQLIDTAKAPMLAYNDKDWDAVRASLSPDFVYDEIATSRKTQGADQAIQLWQGWAAAFPDSRATFHREIASGNTVIFEVSWQGTHQGPLETPGGSIPATGKRIDVRACMAFEVENDRAKVQRHYFDMMTLLRQIGMQ